MITEALFSQSQRFYYILEILIRNFRVMCTVLIFNFQGSFVVASFSELSYLIILYLSCQQLFLIFF